LWSEKVPGRERAPGPGRSDAASTSPFPVAPKQKTEASVAAAELPFVITPAGEPVSVIVRQAVLPKHPNMWPPVLVWPGQKLPLASVAVAVPVVSGERLTLIGPTCEPSMQRPPPGVQGCVPSAPPVGQSRVRPEALVLVQARPARGPRSQVPVPGLVGNHTSPQTDTSSRLGLRGT
jgi:hypothetical protein